mgnify:CR=1 FL=1
MKNQTLLFVKVMFGILAITDTIQADILTFHFPPPGYGAACKEFYELKEKGLTVKSDRLASEYRKKHIWPVFMLKPGEKRTVRIVSELSFLANSDSLYANQYNFFADWTEKPYPEYDVLKHGTYKIEVNRLSISPRELEAWQSLLEKQSAKKAAEEESDKGYFSEILIVFEQPRIRQKESIAQDCFDSPHGWANWEISINAPHDGKYHLSSYKLRPQNVKSTPSR